VKQDTEELQYHFATKRFAKGIVDDSKALAARCKLAKDPTGNAAAAVLVAIDEAPAAAGNTA